MAEDRRGAEVRARRAEAEVTDLREAYARKIASTEIGCEQRLRKEEAAMQEWYRERKREISEMKAMVTIMHAMFTWKKNRYNEQRLLDQAEFDAQKEALRQDAERMKREHTEALAKFEQTLKDRSEGYERQISDLKEKSSRHEEVYKKVEDQLNQSRTSCTRLSEANDALRRDVESLKRRLMENEKAEELARKKAHIEALEAELKRTRKMMEDKRNAEAEALRKELMDYVKFIVHLLPEDWHAQAARLGDERLPKELKERLNWDASPLPTAALARTMPPPQALQPLTAALVGQPPPSARGGGLPPVGPPQVPPAGRRRPQPRPPQAAVGMRY